LILDETIPLIPNHISHYIKSLNKKKPSAALEILGKLWAARVPPRIPLGELTALPQSQKTYTTLAIYFLC